MSLTLTVLSFKNRPANEIKPVSIGNEGGSIGRSVDNTLVLPDAEKFVSRHHASIKVENGVYYLSDTSLSGVYINGERAALHNATERLDNGTVLKIGEYEIAVAITANPSVTDDFSFAFEPMPTNSADFLPVDEPWLESENLGANSLMTDNFPSHEELVKSDSNRRIPDFKSNLLDKQSPLFDSYIAPSVIPSPVSSSNNIIPENFSFDDLFSEPDKQVGHEAIVNNDFANFFDAAISDITTETEQLAPISEIPTALNHEVIEPVELFANNNRLIDSPNITDSALFNAFLQGAKIDDNKIQPEQQTETLHRIGQMFRKLIDGTVSVLRSRAEFKSLCRVNMTVIKATDNNPLKFTVSTDDILQKLLENKVDGFLPSTVAIEEAFNDITNHQLAMQAGIQASLTDLLQRFDPKVIDKQFEHGLVLQKKAKCWESYEKTYQDTVEEAVDNFFGDAFVEGYEKQMRLLTKSRKK
jgi:type VI secretion system FHA domain protein